MIFSAERTPHRPRLATARRRGAATTAVALLALAGCGVLGPDLDERSPVGTRLVTWTETDEPGVADLVLDPPVLATDGAGLDDLLALFPPSVDTAPLDRVDLAGTFLVATTWNRCTERSRVVVDDDGASVEVQIVGPREQVACESSPRQLEVWAVDRAALDGDEPRVTGPGCGRDLDDGRVERLADDDC